jgi:hypothetical protein
MLPPRLLRRSNPTPLGRCKITGQQVANRIPVPCRFKQINSQRLRRSLESFHNEGHGFSSIGVGRTSRAARSSSSRSGYRLGELRVREWTALGLCILCWSPDLRSGSADPPLECRGMEPRGGCPGDSIWANIGPQRRYSRVSRGKVRPEGSGPSCRSICAETVATVGAATMHDGNQPECDIRGGGSHV